MFLSGLGFCLGPGFLPSGLFPFLTFVFPVSSSHILGLGLMYFTWFSLRWVPPPCSGLSVWGLLLSSPRGSPAGHVSPTFLPTSSSPRPLGLRRLQVSSLLDAPSSPHSRDGPGCGLQALGDSLSSPLPLPCPSLCVCVLLGPLCDGGSCLHEVSEP